LKERKKGRGKFNPITRQQGKREEKQKARKEGGKIPTIIWVGREERGMHPFY